MRPGDLMGSGTISGPVNFLLSLIIYNKYRFGYLTYFTTNVRLAMRLVRKLLRKQCRN